MKLRLILIVLFLCFIGGALVSASALNAVSVAGDAPTHVAQIPLKPARPAYKVVVHKAGLPERIRIKKLGVNATVESVGLTSSGAMETPSDWWTTGWYDGGPRPGEPGNSVIAGHYDSDTGPAVFVGLDNLKKDDEIEITDDRGNVWTFVVMDTAAYEEGNAPMKRIFGDSRGIHLNLVTCDGTWDTEKQEYAKRFVVFTTLKKMTSSDEA